MVGRRGEAPLVPPYILCNFKRDGAVTKGSGLLDDSLRPNYSGLSLTPASRLATVL